MESKVYDNNDLNLVKPFAERFARVDGILNASYGRTDGFERYLIEMESIPYSEYYPVDGWQDDFRMLKLLLHKKQCMGNRREVYDHKISRDDLNYLENFYKRLLRGKDPLSMLARYGETGRTRNITKIRRNPPKEQGAKAVQKGLNAVQVLLLGTLLLVLMIVAILCIIGEGDTLFEIFNFLL